MHGRPGSHGRVLFPVARVFALVAALLIPGGAAFGQEQPARDRNGLPLWEIAVYEDFPVRLELRDAVALQELLQRVPVTSFSREQIRPAQVPAVPGALIFEPRVTDREAAALRAAGYTFTVLPDLEQEGRRAVEAFWAEQAAKGFAGLDPSKALYYPTHAQIGADFAALAAAHPTLARTFTWGNSVQGRALWGIVISDDVQNTEAEPEVRLSSTMHGDEPVDMVMLWNLAQYLVNNYGLPGYEDVTDLVDNTEIHIMPLHNPDGYTAGTRTNANGVDLNRNFPEPAGTHLTTQVENLAFMDHANTHHFVVSQNGHGGALVVNYPWDYTFTLAPDNDAIIDLSLEYSTYNLPMYNGAFPQGITNGADWYVALGTLQDWSYFATGCIDVTIEIGNLKWPAASQLDGFWDDNRESLMHYVKAARYGIHGTVTDAVTGQPLAATVTVTGNTEPVTTDPDHGDYYKLLPTGTFELTFTAAGHTAQTVSGVPVTWGTPVTVDVALQPLGTTETVVLFASDFEAGTGGWTGTWGPAVPAEGHDSLQCIEDSPGTSYPNSTTSTMTMSSGVDLTDAVGGQIRFWAKWDIQALWDACFFEASINGGATWTPVATEHTGLTSGQGAQIPGGVPAFDGVQSVWILNTADLTPVLGTADLRLRFRMASNASTTGAGFYLDDFAVEILRLVVSDTVPGVRVPVAAVRAWPNPFNPATTVSFTVPAAGPARLTIHDVQGRLVRTLVDEPLPAGDGRRLWDGRTDSGAQAASGVYFARLVSGSAGAVSKLTLVQ